MANIGSTIDNISIDQYSGILFDQKVYAGGDEYDRSGRKQRITFSDYHLCQIYSGYHVWMLTNAAQYIKMSNENFTYCVSQQKPYAVVLSMILPSSANLVGKYFYVLSTFDPNDTSTGANGNYYKPALFIRVDNGNIVVDMYQNYVPGTYASKMYVSVSIPNSQLRSGSLFSIKVELTNFESESGETCLKLSLLDANNTRYWTASGLVANQYKNGWFGDFYIGGYGNGLSTSSSFASMYITNFSVQNCANAVVGPNLDKASSMYYVNSVISYPTTIFLLSCDMLPPLDNGASASQITGVFPTQEWTNTLFGRPTYKFTGTQYLIADNVSCQLADGWNRRIEFWFKATQTSAKAVIFSSRVDSATDAYTTDCYIDSNQFILRGYNSAGSSIWYGNFSFTDTSSWHNCKIYYYYNGYNTTTNPCFVLDGVRHMSSGTTYLPLRSNGNVPIVMKTQIGAETNSHSNGFQGYLSNFMIDDGYLDSSKWDDTVPTKPYQPTDYF